MTHALHAQLHLRSRAEGRLDEVVGAVLRCLVGESLLAVTSAADMIVLGFGADVLPRTISCVGANPERAAAVQHGNRTPMARIRLHIQCLCHIDAPSGEPAAEPAAELTARVGTLCDRRW